MFHKVALSSVFRLEHNSSKLTISLGSKIKFKLTSCEKSIVTETLWRKNMINKLVLALQISDPLTVLNWETNKFYPEDTNTVFKLLL